ncbi:alcohol dehydrogenase [Diplodia corticola]|uniref:Alcohol dehydrogenase n=1 Tax=Diplodia corticola TaxID=236234 RepID=A0A1J9S8M4_9PEZI|nr:alcohol dehydrogenase [Diplodia corticola]OJD35933.1 alcohol dehydrogenase [Diplodia corticola]
MAPSVVLDNGDPARLNARTSVSGFQKYGNPSLKVTADHRIEMEEAPIPEPGPGEVLIHIKATGVCGSDIHFWKRGRIGALTIDGDCILGHEAAGVVLAAHPTVTTLAPGDAVALEPGVPCGACFLCRAGRYNLCAAVAFAGVYPHPGTIRRFATHPARWCHKIPGCSPASSPLSSQSSSSGSASSLSFGEAALLEPLSVVLHGVRTAPLSLGSPALVCGAGPIGLLALAAARASGAHPLVVTDLEPRRLEFARKYVPGCRTYRVDPALGAEGNAQAVRRLFLDGGGGREAAGLSEEEKEYLAPDTVLECTGVESSVCTAAFAARRGGTVCVIGVGKDVMNNLPFMHMSLAEINLKFINRYRDTWPAGISALSGGILDVKPLISHVFPLAQAKEALELCSDLSHGSIKVQIVDDVEVPIP